MRLSTLDMVIFSAYALMVLGIGLYVSRRKKGRQRNAEDYFLAGKSLPWWAIGASLIAANISAEQFIGMTGSGFAIGLAIASYEWMAALTLIVVGKYFLPVFIKQGIYTIPEFVELRFSKNLKTILAVFWISLFVLVNLTSVLYLGARALDTILGHGDGSLMVPGVLALAAFAAAYSLWGGLSAVAWTDMFQVVLLVIGGVITTVLALKALAPDGSVLMGVQELYLKVPEKFHMILSQGELIKPNGQDAWWDLPGMAVLVGGLWVANFYYWGFNQYIIQRTLAAKSVEESQKGIVLAAFLKLIIPLIVVIPGIVAYAMNLNSAGQLADLAAQNGFVSATGDIINDNAAPWLIHTFVPSGLTGLVLAALAAAIVSSLASMLNSTSTIFTMDIYKPYFHPGANDVQTVRVGRVTVMAALIIAVSIAPLLGNLGQAFQFIQEYTGIVSPGILAVFIAGLFLRKATNNAAIWGVMGSIPVALFFKIGPKGWSSYTIFVQLPFLHQMMITFLISMAIILIISYIENRGKDSDKAIRMSRDTFTTPISFNISAVIIMIICTFLYAFFW